MDMNHAAWMQDALEDARLTRTRTNLLYSQSLLTFSFPVVAAAAIVAFLWDLSPRHGLIAWSTAVLVLSACRYGLLWRYRAQHAASPHAHNWLNLFAAGALVSGVLWGTAPILLVPREPSRLVELAVYRGLIIVVVCGLVAGAAVAYAASLRVLFCYIVPALLPPALYLIPLGDRLNSALGGFVLLYFTFVSTAAVRMHHQLRRHFEMEYELERLRRDLSGHGWK